MYFNTIIVFIELYRGIRFIIPVHDRIHQKFPRCPVWVIRNGFFPENTNRNRAFLRHTRFDECVYFNEVMAKVIPELVFIDDFPCTIHTFETDILDISSRKIAPRISPEQNNASVRRTVISQVEKSE